MSATVHTPPVPGAAPIATGFAASHADVTGGVEGKRKRPVNPIFRMLYGRGIMCRATSFVQKPGS
jgi:hypothetical protein